MKKLLIGVTLALALVTVMPRAASAQATGATDIDITLEGIIILHFFSEVDVTINSADMASFLGIGPAVDQGASGGIATLVGTDFEVDLNIVPTDPVNDPASANLVLQNAWAVRALSTPGTDVGVTGSVTGNPLAHVSGGGEFIDITNATAAPASFASPGLVFPQYGDVTLALDFTNATAAGTYNNGGEYTLTADFI